MMYKKTLIGSAALLLAAPLVVAAQFTPADTGTRPAPQTTEMRPDPTMRPVLERTDEEIARAKERASEEVARRLQKLNATAERVQHMQRVHSTFKNTLSADINEHIREISNVRARMEAGSDLETARQGVEAVDRSYRAFALMMPKAHIAAAADRIVTMTAVMSEMGLKLRNRIDAATQTGADTAALVEALRSLSAHIDSANFHAQEAVNGIATLTPDQGDEEVLRANQVALKMAREELRLAHQDVVEGRADIRAIIEGLKALNPNADTSTDTSAEASVEVQ